MKPVSDAWDAAVRSGYVPTVRAEAWRDNAKVANLPVVAGSYTASESAQVRAQVRLALSLSLDTDLYALLSLDDTDVRVWAGMDRVDGSHEEVPDLWGRVQSAHRSGLFSAPEVTVGDYASVMMGARLLRPWTTPAGVTVVSEIARLARDVDPSIVVVDATRKYPSPRTAAATWDRERWDAIEALAAGIGCEAVFDASRVLVVRPVPAASGVPAWTIQANTDDGVLTDLEISADAPGYNAVVASSTPEVAGQVSSTAYAPSWRAGVKRPRFYSSPTLTTTAACESAARSILLRSQRFQQSVTPRAVPNPALEVGDVVRVVHPTVPGSLRVVTDISRDYGPADAMPIGTRVDVDVATTLSGDLA